MKHGNTVHHHFQSSGRLQAPSWLICTALPPYHHFMVQRCLSQHCAHVTVITAITSHMFVLLIDFKTLVWVDTVVPWPWQQYCLCSVTVLHTTLQEGETDFTIPVASVHNVSQLHRWDLLHLRSKTEGCHDNQLGRKEQKLVINLINAFIYIPTLATLPSVSTDWLVERRLQNLTFWARVSTKTASPFMSDMVNL